MLSNAHQCIGLRHPTAHLTDLSKRGIASAAPPTLFFAPILSPSFLFNELKPVRISRLTHNDRSIQHVMTLLPTRTHRKQPSFNAAYPGCAFANKPNAALPQPTLTLIKFAPRPLSEAFVECLRVMAESVIKGAPAHSLLNASPPERTRSPFATFYLSPYFAKLLTTFDNRVRRDSEWFSLLDECEALLNRDALHEPRCLSRLTAQVHMGRVKHSAQRALSELSATTRRAKGELLGTWLAPEGLLLAAGDSDRHQRIRLGRQWVKDQHGKRIELRPDGLPFRWFVRWLVQRAHRLVEGILLDQAGGGRPLDLLETNRVDFAGFATEIVDRHPEASVFTPSPEALLEVRTLLATLANVATPRERELLSLLEEGASREEAAALLEVSRATVDVHCSNLRQKLRAL
jgi:hypothetical protein